MHVWHLTPDAPRTPDRVSAEEWVALEVGTWPIEPGQHVWAEVETTHADGSVTWRHAVAEWQHNRGENSYWRAELAPFRTGDEVRYHVRARSPAGGAEGPVGSFRVGPKIYLAIVWHQHQPLYRDASLPSPKGSYLESAVRRHAIRDYYAMAALAATYPGVHLTISLTPSLLSQIEDYVEGGATDRALELTRTPAERLALAERDEMLRTFFDAHYENQIRPHRRYVELRDQAQAGRAFAVQDVRDLQMWFNLAWFAKEFREGSVQLVTGEVASVQTFVSKQRDFTVADLEAMVAEQYKILRAIIPIHRQLQDRAQIEVATSPYFHPILPLIVDTDAATVDRPGATLPPRFSYPDDAAAQVRLAVDAYSRWFGRPPRGMWPAEGAVSASVVPIFARQGVRWIATDRRVLARSGRWGYAADDPNVFCQPYRSDEGNELVSVFFRDAWLSDHIGFHYQRYADYDEAAREFLGQVKQRYARRVTGTEDRVLTVVLDGENAWSAYREDARPFLHALYRLLERDPEVQTVTLGEYLDGSEERHVAPHPVEQQQQVHALYTGSWADETGTPPGVEMGTWIGERDENEAWALLGEVRGHLAASGATPESAPAAFRAVYAAEGSDWYWWLGSDQESARERELDELFHAHLRAVYYAIGEHPPDHVSPHETPPTVVWTPTCRPTAIGSGERLLIRTESPGTVSWSIDGGPEQSVALVPVRRTMLDVQHYQRILGPFPPGARRVRLSVRTSGLESSGTVTTDSCDAVIRIAAGEDDEVAGEEPAPERRLVRRMEDPAVTPR
jgi:alpha-amylase/alpha-mannosidase (GH57 family)